MRSLKKALLAGALSFAATGLAMAADMVVPEPIYTPAPAPAPEPAFGGWYLRGDIGFSNQKVGKLENSSFTSAGTTVTVVDKSFDAAPFGGVGIGYRFNSWLRTDATIEYRGKATFHGHDTYVYDTTGTANDLTGSNDYTGSKSEITGLLNAYVDLGTWKGVTPFLGAGIGYTSNTISSFTDSGISLTGSGGIGQSSSLAYGKTTTKGGLAWALMAGLAYEVTPNLSMELGYRYINLGDAESGDLVDYLGNNSTVNPMKFKDITSNDIRFGMRWALGGAEMPAQPIQPEPSYPPIISK